MFKIQLKKYHILQYLFLVVASRAPILSRANLFN